MFPFFLCHATNICFKSTTKLVYHFVFVGVLLSIIYYLLTNRSVVVVAPLFWLLFALLLQQFSISAICWAQSRHSQITVRYSVSCECLCGYVRVCKYVCMSLESMLPTAFVCCTLLGVMLASSGNAIVVVVMASCFYENCFCFSKVFCRTVCLSDFFYFFFWRMKYWRALNIGE